MRIRNIAIVSLSCGLVGEPFVQFEAEIGLRRLKEYGLNVKFMPHARMGIEYTMNHPEKRAEDLLEAFRDPAEGTLRRRGSGNTYGRRRGKTGCQRKSCRRHSALSSGGGCRNRHGSH